MTLPATADTNGSNGDATKAVAKQPTPIGQLRGLLEKALPQIKMALPRHMTAERMLRVAITAAQRTPELLECDKLSFVGAVVQASQLGLEPDGILGACYLLPFFNKKTNRKEVQLIAGYKGLIDLARRSGHVASISAHVVYEQDRFTFAYGIEDKLEHVPHMGKDRGKPVAAYAIARFKDGGYAFDVMSVDEIEAIRSKSKAGNFGPWVDYWSEMARKTVIRRLCKYLPLSPELQKAVSLDEAADAGVAQSLDIEVESSEAVAAATADRQAALRGRYAGNGNVIDDAAPIDTGEVAAPEQVARLNALADQINEVKDGAGIDALAAACDGQVDLDNLTAAQAVEAEAYLSAFLDKVKGEAAPKGKGGKGEAQGRLA